MDGKNGNEFGGPVLKPLHMGYLHEDVSAYILFLTCIDEYEV